MVWVSSANTGRRLANPAWVRVFSLPLREGRFPYRCRLFYFLLSLAAGTAVHYRKASSNRSLRRLRLFLLLGPVFGSVFPCFCQAVSIVPQPRETCRFCRGAGIACVHRTRAKYVRVLKKTITSFIGFFILERPSYVSQASSGTLRSSQELVAFFRRARSFVRPASRSTDYFVKLDGICGGGGGGIGCFLFFGGSAVSRFERGCGAPAVGEHSSLGVPGGMRILVCDSSCAGACFFFVGQKARPSLRAPSLLGLVGAK